MPSNTRAYTTTTGTLYRNAYTTAPEAYTATAAAGRYSNRRGGDTAPRTLSPVLGAQFFRREIQ